MINIITSKGILQVPETKTCYCGKRFNPEQSGHDNCCSDKCYKDYMAVMDYNLDQCLKVDKVESANTINLLKI